MAKTYLKEISIPEGVKVTSEDNKLNISGKLGNGQIDIHKNVKIVQNEQTIAFTPTDDLQENQALTGTMRALTFNIIEGVTKGFEKKLEINGVGYRAKLQGNTLELSLGFSHPIKYQLPEGVSADLPSQTEITLKSLDKQLVGQAAAEIRKYRPSEPYKGKGVKYFDERIRRKESKKT